MDKLVLEYEWSIGDKILRILKENWNYETMKKSTRKYGWMFLEYCWNLGEIRVDMDDICVLKFG